MIIWLKSGNIWLFLRRFILFGLNIFIAQYVKLEDGATFPIKFIIVTPDGYEIDYTTEVLVHPD